MIGGQPAHCVSHGSIGVDTAEDMIRAGERQFSAVFLEDCGQHPRERQRIELTAKLIEDRAASVVRTETEGESPTERLLGAVMLGDLVSLELAARRGVDPTTVEVIDRLKDELGEP